MDITNFCTQWERIEHHRVEELACEDHRLGAVVAQLDYVLLDPANLLDGQDSAKLTTRHEYSITAIKNLIDVVNRLFVFEFRHDSHVRVDAQISQLLCLLQNHLFQIQDFQMAAVNRVDDIVDIVLQNESDVFSERDIIVVIVVCLGCRLVLGRGRCGGRALGRH